MKSCHFPEFDQSKYGVNNRNMSMETALCLLIEVIRLRLTQEWIENCLYMSQIQHTLFIWIKDQSNKFGLKCISNCLVCLNKSRD